MGRQRCLVLLLTLALGVVQVTLTYGKGPDVVEYDARSPDDDVHKKVSTGIRISSPKVNKVAAEDDAKSEKAPSLTSTALNKAMSPETLHDILEVSKHNPVVANDLRRRNIVPASSNRTSDGNKEPHYDDDSYYEYDDDSYDDAAGPLPTDKSKSNVIAKATDVTTTTTTTTSGTAKKPEQDVKSMRAFVTTKAKEKKAVPKPSLNTRDSPKVVQVGGKIANGGSIIANANDEYEYEDEDDDDDNADDDDDDVIAEETNDDDNEVNSFGSEKRVNKETNMCPENCVCDRNLNNNYLVATCNRLDLDKQQFSADITDLVVSDVEPKYPILLGPSFFSKIGLNATSTITISNCTIESIDETAFHYLDNLYSVNLTNVGLTMVASNTFAKNLKLRLLTISGNDLSSMFNSPYIIESRYLEELDLSQNNIKQMQASAFSQLPNIVYINLAKNGLKEISASTFRGLVGLEELDLSDNWLESLPAHAFYGTELAILRLKNNIITSRIPIDGADLQEIDLSYNSIKHINQTMFMNIRDLVTLNLRGNGFTNIPPGTFDSLKNLRSIDLSVNELDQVSKDMFHYNIQLDVVRLNDNPRLSQLPPDGFTSHTGALNVFYLDISNCAIGALGYNTFATMPRLATLNMAWNNINNLEPNTFVALRNLENLDLSNNLIVTLDDKIFQSNNMLVKLSLAGNPIQKLSAHLFSKMNKLRSLDVSECELRSLLTDKMPYKFFETLVSFNASGNRIKKITKNNIMNFTNLRSLDISLNPLKCNKEFKDFLSFVKTKKILTRKMDILERLESSASNVEVVPLNGGWAELENEVCKTADSTIRKPESGGVHLENRVSSSDIMENFNKDKNNLKNILESNTLRKMQTILKDSHEKGAAINMDPLNDIAKDENDSNNAEEDKEADDDDDDDEEENESEYDDEDDDEDDDDDDDTLLTAVNAKKKEGKAQPPKIGIPKLRVDEVDLKKETKDKFLLDKFLLSDEDSDDDESSNSDEDAEEELIIERGRVYFVGNRFLIPLIIIIICVVIFLLSMAKIALMVIRKRGERYRMALLASTKNSIVYQKLSEEIKPTVKEMKPTVKEIKHVKIHRYSPINQV